MSYSINVQQASALRPSSSINRIYSHLYLICSSSLRWSMFSFGNNFLPFIKMIYKNIILSAHISSSMCFGMLINVVLILGLKSRYVVWIFLHPYDIFLVFFFSVICSTLICVCVIFLCTLSYCVMAVFLFSLLIPIGLTF
jgi:hypothetical protein